MASLCDQINAKVIEQLEQDQMTWLRPASHAYYAVERLSHLRSNSVRYRGMNRINLALTGALHDYRYRRLLTANQAIAFGGSIMEGATPARIMKYIPTKKQRSEEKR